MNAGKQVYGRKRHILVDTLGLVLVVVVTAASLQDAVGTIIVSALNTGHGAMLANVSAVNLEGAFRVEANRNAAMGGHHVLFHARRIASGTEYMARVRLTADNGVRLQAQMNVGGVVTSLGSEVAVSGLTQTANTRIRVRVSVTGTHPTTIRMRAWADGAMEPTTWNYSVTDSTEALQAAGGVGLRGYVPSTATSLTLPLTLSFDDFRVTTGGETPPSTTTRTLAYTYDGLQRLTGATESPGRTYGYTYDKSGNRTQATVSGSAVETRTYNLANQVNGWGYDAAGNAITVTDALGTAIYSYDNFNRTKTMSVNGVLQAGFAYDGDGNLIAQGSAVGTSLITFTQDLAAPLSRILQATPETGASTTYLYGTDLLASVQDGTHTWYGGDALGSVRQRLDLTGQPLLGQNYDPWGVPDVLPSTTFGYTGEWQDSVTGLVNLRARWYQPRAGRFLTRDPFEGFDNQPQSLHQYSYVHNQPINFTDPTGKYLCDTNRKEYSQEQTYSEYCHEQKARLDTTRDTSSSDVLGGLIGWFLDQTLPGGDQSPKKGYWSNASSASERLDFVLWYTHTGVRTHSGWSRNHSGFPKQYQDPWPDSRDQVGHFLTAVDIGRSDFPPYYLCALGHELVGDGPYVHDALIQCGTPTPSQTNYFFEALEAEVVGNDILRDCLIARLLPELPEELDANDPQFSGRQGNSRQDLRLTLKGLNFGKRVQMGNISTPHEASMWLVANLRK